MKPLTSYTAL